MLQSRTTTTGSTTFLEPTFADSTSHRARRATRCSCSACVLGTVARARRASRSPTASGCGGPGTSAAHRRRASRGAARAVRQQVVLRRADRPARRAPVRVVRALRPADVRARRSSTARSSAARPALVRAGSAAVRARRSPASCAPTRRCSSSASSPSPSTSCSGHDAPPLRSCSGSPLAAGLARRCSAGARGARWRRPRRLGARAGLRDRRGRRRLRRRPGGLQFVTDETWIAQLGIHYKLGLDGLNLFLDPARRACCSSPARSGPRCTRVASARGCSSSGSALAETGVLGALLAQDLALFVIFFDLMLVPFLFLTGSWGGPDRVPRDHQALHLHAGRLAADARRRRSPPACSPAGRRTLTFAFTDLAPRARARQRLAGLDLPRASPPPSS